jgi:polysaccharide pyruvyl transferase WcaK-like protein
VRILDRTHYTATQETECTDNRIRDDGGKPRPKTTTLVGYHGYHNLGDDIFRRLVCRWLDNLLDVGTCYISIKPGTTEYTNSTMRVIPFSTPVTRISRLLWLNVFRNSLASYALIFSAGSIFTIQPFFLIYLVLRLLRLFRGKKLTILALGVSIGPFRTRSDHDWCLKCLSLMDYILVRDAQSKVIIDRSQQPINAELSFDLALCCKTTPTQVGSAEQIPILGVAVTERAFGTCTTTHSRNCESLLQALQSALVTFPNVRIRILCVCTDKHDGDRDISQHLHETLSKTWRNRIELLSYENDQVEDMLRFIAECSLLISARMHAGIMGTLASIPVYQISYADKIRNFYLHSQLSTEYLHDHTHFTPQSISEFISKSLLGQLKDFACVQKTILEEKGRLVSQQLEGLAKRLTLGHP